MQAPRSGRTDRCLLPPSLSTHGNHYGIVRAPTSVAPARPSPNGGGDESCAQLRSMVMGRRAISLGLLLVGSILSACGDDDDAGNTAPANGADASTVGAIAARPLHLADRCRTGCRPATSAGCGSQEREDRACGRNAHLGRRKVRSHRLMAGALAVETELWIESTDKTGIGPEMGPPCSRRRRSRPTSSARPARPSPRPRMRRSTSAPTPPSRPCSEQILTASNGVLKRPKNSTYEIAADGKRTFKGDGHFSPVVRARTRSATPRSTTPRRARRRPTTTLPSRFSIGSHHGASTVNEKEAIYEHHPRRRRSRRRRPTRAILIEVGGAGE